MNHRLLSLSVTPGCVRLAAGTIALLCASGGVMSAENDRRTVTANDTPISENFPAVEVAPPWTATDSRTQVLSLAQALF
jgi:hypothetical protein